LVLLAILNEACYDVRAREPKEGAVDARTYGFAAVQKFSDAVQIFRP